MESPMRVDLISADKVEGTNVYSPAKEKLGHIENLMIDKQSGKVAYAIMSFGGFLGVGERLHPLPWSILKYDRSQGGYVVNLDKRTLEGAPQYEPAAPPNYADTGWGTQVHSYYKVPPYWTI